MNRIYKLQQKHALGTVAKLWPILTVFKLFLSSII